MEVTMNILSKLYKAHQRSRAARQLRDLPPYLLQDIGVDSDHIDEAVAGLLARNEARAAHPAQRLAPKAAPSASLLGGSASSKAEWPYSHRRAA
jgi:uncharacterized protein YjiS (DUF1127 family)